MNLKKAILLIAFSCLLFLYSSHLQSSAFDEHPYFGKHTGIPHVDSAITYVGVSDNGTNSGYWVEKWQKNVGISKGSPWCAAFVYSMLKAAGINYKFPKSGQAQKFITKHSIKAINVFSGVSVVPDGSLIIWKKGNTWKGHIGIVITWLKKSGWTIEGNTAPNNDRDGGYVMARKRTIQPYNFFRITHFTPVTYD